MNNHSQYKLPFFFSFHVRVAWGSRLPCSIMVAGYACSHPFMVFNRVVSLLAVDLVVVGSLENTWLVSLGCPVCGLKCIPLVSLVHVVGFPQSGHTPCILCLDTCFCSWS